MIEIKKAEQSRCCNCCSSKQDVYNVTFWQNETNSGTQVALCKKCMDELGKLARLIEPEGDSDDLISRKEMIRAIDSLGEDYIAYYKLLMLICRLPSAESKEQTAKVEQQEICWEDIRHYKEGMCASCGRNVYDHAKYCDECGARLEWE